MTFSNELASRIHDAFEKGLAQEKFGVRFLSLAKLESGTEIAFDRSMRWLAVPSDEREPFVYGEGTEHVLTEAIESKRDDFEALLARGATALGLPPDDVVLAFPSVGLVRAVLAKPSTYLMRLALQWIHPSELRDLRADLVRVSQDKLLPRPIKDLAERLIVPE
jgi:hypothetical protein